VTAVTEVTRILPVNYRRLTRSVAGWVALLILLATLVLCLSNFGLTKYAAIGILAGIIFWKWPLWVRYALGVAIVIICLAACSASSRPGPRQFYWQASYIAQITLNSSGTIWTVQEQVTIPTDALRQITEGSGQFAVNLPPPRPGQIQQDINRLTRMLEPEGLTWTGVDQGNEPIFTFPPRTLTHRVPIVPLVTAQTVHLPYVTLPGNVNVVPGDDSKVVIDAPSGLIEATTPTSEAGPTTTGEERVIGAESFSNLGTSSVAVSISALSVLARDEPLRSMAGLSLAGGISWVIACIWTLLVALAQTGAKAAATSGWKRVRRAKAPASADKPDAGKTGGNTPAEPEKAQPQA
jgi:hypothetical protein